MSSTITSIWATINSWFTPTVLFLLLNLMVITIAIINSISNNNPAHHDQHQNRKDNQPSLQQLTRSPSMILQRLKSINFYTTSYINRSYEPTPTTTTTTTNTLDYHENSQVHHEFDHSHQLNSLQNQLPPQQPPSRSPSILQRLRSFNLYNDLSASNPIINQESAASKSLYSHEQKQAQPHEKSEENYEEEEEQNEEDEEEEVETLDEIYSRLLQRNNNKQVAKDEVPTIKLTKKMSKSLKLASNYNVDFKEEEDIVESRSPSTVREGKSSSGSKAIVDMDDAEVDARADDFINKFKQQLKLQRIDSIIRGIRR